LATTSLEAKNYRAALAYSEDVLRAVPDHAEAIRIREAASAMLKRFDDSIARATERLAAGDTDRAASALNTARSIDPAASAVGELSAQLVDQLKTQAAVARTEAAQRYRTPSSSLQPQASSGPARPGGQRQTRVETPAAAPQSPPPSAPVSTMAATTPLSPLSSASVQPVPPPAQTAVPGAIQAAPPEPIPQARPQGTPPAETSADRRNPSGAATRSGEDDESAIRRVVATYARAIETKDLALFRSVKPNLSAAEQRRIEDGFRAVSSQQVTITILSIEQRGQEASVRLSRRDTIQAAGRPQTTERQQTLTLTHSGGGWVVREIGQ
jgi:hypothetical protein